MRILVAEDDRTIAMGLAYSLEQEGYFPISCYDYKSALETVENTYFDMALLDLGLPGGSGYELCRKIKAKGEIPVVFLTACDEEVNVVMGLDMGADDYITKPFRVRELMSRLRSVNRRYRAPMKTANELFLGNIRVSVKEARVFRGEEEIVLTALEYRLLLLFINNKGIVMTRSRLLEELWDVTGDFVNDNTLTVYIKRLRDKLERDPENPQLIKTVRGLGYKAGDKNAV